MPKQTILQDGTGQDLFCYFHIEGSYIREQAKLATTDTVVSELWGAGSSAYRAVIASYGGWAKYCEGIAARLGKPPFRHTCVTTWSAGSEVLRTICRGTKLPDAIVSLDGIYGSKPPGSRPGDGNVLFDAGLEAIAQYALAAARGERIFVLLHSAIPTRYGSSGECAARIRHFVESELGRPMEDDPTLTAAELDGHQFRDALVLGGFHLIDFAGQGAKEHVREAHLFDEVWRRWIPWARDNAAPAPPPPPVPAADESVLGIGARGPRVESWQHFLNGAGAALVADGRFGPKTEEATKAFQRQHALADSGKVDGPTLEAARALGFGVPRGGPPMLPVEALGPDWPARPDFPPLVGHQARAALFGGFAFEPAPTPGNPEGIRILDGWDRANIVMVEVPQLRRVAGAPKDGRVPFHRLGAERLKELFARWEAAGRIHLVRSWAGSWVPRFVRGSRSTLSNHAFGTALDINAAWNPLGAVPPLAGRVGSVRGLVHIANELGFFWGGHFGSRPDGMHFELARL